MMCTDSDQMIFDQYSLANMVKLSLVTRSALWQKDKYNLQEMNIGLAQSAPVPDILFTMPPLYIHIAEALVQQVARGALRPGDRVPSLRQVSQQGNTSV